MNEVDGNIGHRMATGAFWMVAARFADRGIGLVSTVILARLLVPADFGLVVLATTTIAILEVWSEFGFDLALIRDQDATQDHYDTVWTLTVIRGLFVAFAIGLFAPQIAGFFDNGKMTSVLYVLAFLSVLEGCRSVRIVDFRKNLELGREFSFLMTARVCQFAVTLTLAWLWRDYWALVAGIVTSRTLKFVLSYAMAPHRPRFTLCEFRSLFAFSRWVLINSVLTFVNSRLDNFMVGRFSGASAVGIYSMGYEISNMATTELVWPIARAIYPGFSKLAGSREALFRSYNQAIGLIVLIALPATAGIAMTAEYLVPLMLGPKWLGAIPVMKILAIYGGIRVILANTGSLYYALNRPYLVTLMGSVQIVLIIPLMYFLVQRYGPVGAAWAVAIAYSPSLVLMNVINARLFDASLRDMMKHVVRPLFAVSVMCAVIYALKLELPPSESPQMLAVELVALVIAGVASYALVVLGMLRVFALDDGAERMVFEFLAGRLRRLRRA